MSLKRRKHDGESRFDKASLMQDIPVPEPIDRESPTQIVGDTSKPSQKFSSSASQQATVQKVPIDLLCISPFNARRFRSQDRIQEIAQSLRTHGQQEPIRVYPGTGEHKGKYLIVSGATRFLAAITLNWQSLDAWVDLTLNTDDPIALVSISHLHNDTKSETDMDHAQVVTDLQEKGFNFESITLALGYNTSRKLYKLKALQDLPQSIYKIATENPEKISAEFGNLLHGAASSLGEEIALKLAEEVVSQNLSVAKLNSRIRAENRRKLDSSTKRATKEKSVLIHYGKEKAGNLCLLYMPNTTKRKVQLNALLPEEAAEEFAEELASLIQSMRNKWADEQEAQHD